MKDYSNRREFLRKVGTGTAIAGFGTSGAGLAVAKKNNGRGPFKGDPFTLGVASGDPLPDSVVLWTRLAPEPLQDDGGMPDHQIPVQWRVATDEDMGDIVKKGTSKAVPEHVHSVHVDVRGLESDTEYYYQFKVGPNRSSVARTKTAPTEGSALDEFNFAFASCQNHQYGYYTAYNHLAEENLDLVVFLGDYIYEGPSNDLIGRGHEPPRFLEDLSDYRIRYAQYKTDSNLQAAHAAFPWIVTWDDHEVRNNYADEDSPYNESPEEFLERRADAYQAYFEHQPLRPSRMPDGPDLPLYRRFTFGELAEFNVLDTRQYRDDQTHSIEEAQDPERTILGDEQEEWLLDGLRDSSSHWNVLAQQVPFAATDENPDPDVENFGAGDKWDGYRADRDTLLGVMAQQSDLNPVVITGDVHRNYAYNLKSDFSDPDSETVGTEYIGTSISSFSDGSGTTLLSSYNNSWQQFYNDNRGYVRCTLTPDEWRTDFRVVSTVRNPNASVSTIASFVTESGDPGAELVSDPYPNNSPTRIESTFGNGTDGWGINQNYIERQPEYIQNGGNPGGHISASDSQGGVSWYYVAPFKFLGTREDFYGGTLSFDLRQDRTDNQFDGNPQAGGGDVILFGDGVELDYDYGSVEKNPDTEWTEYSVPLSVEGNWVNVVTGQPPTKEEFQSVLASLESLQIRGEYRSGNDTSYLDNVILKQT